MGSNLKRMGGLEVCVSLHCRSCDSHNLNTNPLCDLTDTAGTRPWARAVKEEYGKGLDIPKYIANLEDPVKKLYPDPATRAGELLLKKGEENPEYDTYKDDIAILNIYFGKSTALGRQHRSLICSFKYHKAFHRLSF